MTHFTRRQFMTGLAATAVLPPFARQALADANAAEIVATTRVLEVKGKAATVFSLDSKQGFVFDHGQDIRLKLSNGLSEPTLIHWHGQTPPSNQDGVPMLSQPVLQRGESY